jgi:HEAT repeat protein
MPAKVRFNRGISGFCPIGVRQATFFMSGETGNPLEAAMTLFPTTSWDVVSRAACLLAVEGPDAFAALTELISRPDPYSRCAAAMAFGKLRDPRCFDLLFSALLLEPADEDSDAVTEARVHATVALAALNDQRALPVVLGLLEQNEDLSLTWHLIDAVAALGNSEHIRFLTPFHGHTDIDVQKSLRRAIKVLRSKPQS